MPQAKQGDTVQVHYTGKLQDGTVFDSSTERGPIEFTIGEGQVIAGFEEAVEGMEAGSSQTAEIPASQAYGPRREELLLEISQKQLAAEMEPEVGQQLQLDMQDGRTLRAVISAVQEEQVVLDANHPLAGEDLVFDLELVAIK